MMSPKFSAFPANVTKGSDGAIYCKLPLSQVNDSDASPTILKRRAKCYTWLGGVIGAGPNTIAKCSLQEKQLFEKANAPFLLSLVTSALMFVMEMRHFRFALLFFVIA